MDMDFLIDKRNAIESEIRKTVDVINSSKNVDEYIYIFLWRPVEWIIDYYILEKRLQEQPDLKPEEFFEDWRKYTVDEKVKIVLDENVFKESLREDIYDLRWYRDLTNHHREEIEAFPLVFSKFKQICDDYLERTGSSLRINIEKEPVICLSEYAGIQMSGEEGSDADLFKETLSYIKRPDAQSLISIMKMEYLAQRYAYYLLIRRKYTICYSINGLSGIFIDENRTNSFIDYFVDDQMRTYPSEIHTKIKLKTIRDIRNRVIHVVDSGNAIIGEFTNVWLQLMQEYYCSNEEIMKLISDELDSYNNVTSMKMLESFIYTYEQFLPKDLIVDIKETLIPAIADERRLRDIKEKYEHRIESASSEEDKDEVLYEFIMEYEERLPWLLSKQNRDSIDRYRGIIEQSMEGYGEYLGETVTKYLLTALTLKDAFEERRFLDVDYAGICIELTRSVENLLYEKVFDKYRKYVQKNSFQKDKLQHRIKEKVNHDKIMLGDYKTIWGTDNIRNGQKQTKEGEVYNDFCKEKHMYNNKVGGQLNTLLKKETQLINVINDKYRINAAHRKEVNKEESEECLKAVLTGKDALLKQILKDMEKKVD